MNIVYKVRDCNELCVQESLPGTTVIADTTGTQKKWLAREYGVQYIITTEHSSKGHRNSKMQYMSHKSAQNIHLLHRFIGVFLHIFS